jgi:hypothetical protein
MLREFISKLDLNYKKKVYDALRQERLTELCLLLRNEIIEYDINGIPLKEKVLHMHI